MPTSARYWHRRELFAHSCACCICLVYVACVSAQWLRARLPGVRFVDAQRSTEAFKCVLCVSVRVLCGRDCACMYRRPRLCRVSYHGTSVRMRVLCVHANTIRCMCAHLTDGWTGVRGRMAYALCPLQTFKSTAGRCSTSTRRTPTPGATWATAQRTRCVWSFFFFFRFCRVCSKIRARLRVSHFESRRYPLRRVRGKGNAISVHLGFAAGKHVYSP